MNRVVLLVALSAPGYKPFTVPAEHRTRYDILNVVVGTDPALAIETRLRGVWYREYFGHAGVSRTLEDWLDPAPGDRKALITFLKTL